MARYAEINGIIDALCKRARHGAEPALLREMEDVLTSGYALALHGDARRRQLQARVENLTRGLPEAEVAKELRRLSLERRSLEDSTRELRTRLNAMRALLMELGGPIPLS